MSKLPRDRVYIIAEAGDNHNGDIKMAYQLIDVAKQSGADAVKFQTFVSELVIDVSAEQADYQKTNTGVVESQLDMVKKLELPQSAFAELKEYAEKLGIDFISTPFDLVSADTLAPIVKFYKVSSGDLVNYLLLKRIAEKGLPVILSCGMSEIDEIDFGIQTLKQHGVKEIGLLHCVSNYPADLADCNMRVIETLSKRYPDVVIGWSDHTLGNTTAIMAVTLGAKIIEKHFTLDKNLPGPDHLASASPEEMADYVRAIRLAERSPQDALNEVVETDYKAAIGDGKKRIMPSEANTADVAKRSLFSSRDIPAGKIITDEDIVALRPSGGISPRVAVEVLGSRAAVAIKSGAKLDWEMLEKQELQARTAVK